MHALLIVSWTGLCFAMAPSAQQQSAPSATPVAAPMTTDVERMLEEAAKTPATPEAIATCVKVLTLDPGERVAARAIDGIVGSGADYKLLLGVAQSASRSRPNSSTEKLLRALIDRVEQRDVQGWAAYSLGYLLLDYATDVAYVADATVPAASRVAYAKQRGETLLAANTARGAEALRTAGIASLRRVVDEFFFAEHRTAGFLGAAADAELFEIEKLQVGMVAPEIEGVDEDGVPFKLSDYRGKVVAVDFWGYWCPICVHNIPGEREFTTRLKDDAFALVGINSDPKDHLAIGMKHLPLSWRSFWDDGDAYGPIATRWNVTSWPMYYVLDENGVIRAKGEDLDPIVATIDELVAKSRERETKGASAPAELRGTR